MKPLYIIKEEGAILHLSKGNSKIGKTIWAFSTLPGNEKHLLVLNHSVLLTDIAGTCSKYCEGCFGNGCYAVNSAKLHHNAVIRAWAENTLLLRSGKLFGLLEEFISKKNKAYVESKGAKPAKITMFRINVSGEVQSVEEFESWNNLAAAHPEIKFGLYTKNFDGLEEFMKRHPEGTVDNLCINISQWNHVADAFLAKYAGKFNVFEYDETNRKSCEWSEEDKKRLAALPHCKAVTKEGHHAKGPDGKDITCDQCTNCYRKTGKTTAVYSH